MASRIIHAPHGSTLTCKGWLQEAAYRMIQNNLDPEVAERPDDLVVYGGRGRGLPDVEEADGTVMAMESEEDTIGADDDEMLAESDA